jgi:lipid II:glycine glycyltransferase (peptidoglycan interpeptide bridge formation enzyme)
MDTIAAPPPPATAADTPSAQTVSPAPSDRWAAWDNFLMSTPETGFMQSSWWADFRVGVGYEYFAIILKHAGSILGGALVHKFPFAPDDSFYYIQDGPVLPDDPSAAADVFAATINAIEDRRRTETRTISHLRIEPRWPRLPDFVSGFRPLARRDSYFEPRTTLCVDVRPSDELILAQMKPKGRYNIRVAQRHGVSVVEDNSAQGLADFLRLYAEMVRRQELKGKPSYYFETLLPALWSVGHGSLFFAEYAGVRLAAALVVFFGRMAIYFYGASLDERRNVMAPYLLHFEIMRNARARGHQWYDFWGICPENEPDHPWQNFSTFKRKFGGVEFNIVPTLDYIYDSAAYDRYVASQDD